jgi:asparagine synthetase B (glutamine-hydrolysing)
MCGIFGLILGEGHRFTGSELTKALETLFQLSETRGREAAGLAVAWGDRIDVIKTAETASVFLRSPEYARLAKALANRPNPQAPIAVIGHARLVTNGLQSLEANNQPTVKDGAIVVHNGIIVNDQELWSTHDDLSRDAEVDTEIFAALYAKSYRETGDPSKALSATFGAVLGETTIAAFLSENSAIAVGTNTGSFFAAQTADNTALAFLSEDTMAQRLTAPNSKCPAFVGAQVVQLTAGQGAIIESGRPILTPFPLNTPPLANPSVNSTLGTARRIETRARHLEECKAGLRRCTRCLLPETMPFIEFDHDGVCSFCHAYQPKVLKGRDALERELDKVRSSDGRPDCLVAFSGGRDSSYGLHLLRDTYNMTPIAYTYDWGMVTDIARRNQARICGALGVEHIWVSADIKAKRRNIRNNVEAWLKKPNLGMIPLFMAGDKQFFWYANKLMKETGVQKIIFCQNDYERTDFKSGFAGVSPKNGAARYYRMNALNMVRLATFYGGQYLLNPGYINRSILDTLFAYVSYYLIEQEYIYLFDYIPWEEDELNKTLLEEYQWEVAADTPTTWRIGDGTAAFYNYIYGTVAGFTENDTFRSNQIRAGVLTRDRAQALVERENQIRWPSIREYLATIGVDLDVAMRAIERMPKLYDHPTA